jgi:citrate lyase subunit beta / citryl-CoA lyase
VPVVNGAFAPSPEEIDWATRVIAAARAANCAAVAVDGAMIDRPVLDLAERVIAHGLRT